MRGLLAVVVGSCLGVALATPASAQWLGSPVRLSAEYAGSVENGPAGWRWGQSLQTLSGRFDLLARSRVSPWLATGVDFHRYCGAECLDYGWSNAVGVRADVLPVRPERRVNPFVVAGFGGVLASGGAGGGLALAGAGLRFRTGRGVDPLVELHWEEHVGHHYAMVALGVNGLLRLWGPWQ